MKFFREDDVVLFTVGYTRGWDICNFWDYYFSPNGILPEKYSEKGENIKKLNQNWFFKQYECK